MSKRKNMLTNEDIVCFSSIDWDFNWQGHQEIMRRLAAAGNRVLFVENTGVRSPQFRDYGRLVSRFRNWWRGYKGIRLEENNLYVFSPLILPFPHSRLARWLNKRLLLRLLNSWCRSQKFNNPVVWSFLPSWLTLELIKGLPCRILIYYCIDSFEHSSPQAARIKASEQEMIRLADLVFVTSEQLREHCSRGNANVHKFPFTVDYEPFEKARESADSQPPGDLGSIPGPRVGYIGGLHRWLDQELVASLAEELPGVNFVFVGPEQEPVDSLRGKANIFLLGSKPHARLPFYLRYFDIALIPYRITDYTDSVYPTKLNEYLAMGLPVVSTPIREVVFFAEQNPEMVSLGRRAGELAEVIRRRLAGKNSPEEREARRARIELARKSSWSVKIEQMSGLIQEKMDAVTGTVQPQWRERLAETLSAHREKTLAVLALAVLLYGVLLYSPLLYFLGSPLKIEEPLVRSSVILVFGGGVGETGRPGISTLERTHYAVELYQKHYADRIIFSSGYQQFRRKDAEDMVNIASGEGVPRESIIIEETAANNYENVVNCLALMRSHGFSSAIVVSGQYNMLRTKLLFEHQYELDPAHGLPSDSLHLAPVAGSIFFHPVEGSRFAQLTAILHEYAAVVNYWWRGLILR